MNKAALNVAWLRMWNTAAIAPNAVPVPRSMVIKPKMADRREREQRFEIMFEERDDSAKHHRDQARRGDDHKPLRRARQHGPHARHQENPGLHHRGGMQIGGHRRRRGHRVGQPEVERELCRLGKAAQQDQHKRGHIKRVRLDQIAVLQDHAEVIADRQSARGSACPQSSQTAHARDRQGHARALAPCGQGVSSSRSKER